MCNEQSEHTKKVKSRVCIYVFCSLSNFFNHDPWKSLVSGEMSVVIIKENNIYYIVRREKCIKAYLNFLVINSQGLNDKKPS